MQHFYGAYTVPLYFHDNAVRLFALTVQRLSRPDAEGSVWARTLVGGRRPVLLTLNRSPQEKASFPHVVSDASEM